MLLLSKVRTRLFFFSYRNTLLGDHGDDICLIKSGVIENVLKIFSHISQNKIVCIVNCL